MEHTNDAVTVTPLRIAAALTVVSKHKRTATHWGIVRHVRETVADYATVERQQLRSPQAVIALCRAMQMEAWTQESFMVMLLDAQHCIINRELIEITRGILDSSLVHPREVFRAAMLGNAASVILVHNHPSGDPTPSTEDRMMTSQLVAAGTLLGIPVRDHIVIGRGRHVSFAEAGWLTVSR